MAYFETAHPDLSVDASGNLTRPAYTTGYYATGLCTNSAHELTGKSYFEATITDLGSSDGFSFIGLGTDTVTLTLYLGGYNSDYSVGLQFTGNMFIDGSSSSLSMPFTFGDTVMVAFDKTYGRFWFGVNGTWYGGGNPAAGTNPTGSISQFTSNEVYPGASIHGTDTQIYLRLVDGENVYSIPSGFSMPVAAASSNDLEGEIQALDGDFVIDNPVAAISGDLDGEITTVTGAFQSGYINDLDGEIENVEGSFGVGPQWLAHYTLDTLVDGNVYDLMFGSSATVSGMEETTGKISGGLSSASLASSANGIELDTALQDVRSIAFWYKTPSTETGNCFLVYGKAGAGYPLYLYWSATGYLYYHYSSSTTYLVSGATKDTDQWVHIALITNDDEGTDFYIDGTYVNTVDLISFDDELAGFGYYETFVNAHVPALDDIRIYSDSLTAAQVATLAAMTDADYSFNSLDASITTATGDFTGTSTAGPLWSDFSGEIEAVTGEFVSYQRLNGDFSGAITGITGEFVGGAQFWGTISRITGSFTGVPGEAGALSATISSRVTASFSSGALFSGSITGPTATLTASQIIAATLNGVVSRPTGAFAGRKDNILSGSIERIVATFSGTAKTNTRASLYGSIAGITGSMQAVTGVNCYLMADMHSVDGYFHADEYGPTDNALNGEILPAEGYMLCLADYDHGIMRNVRGAVR